MRLDSVYMLCGRLGKALRLLRVRVPSVSPNNVVAGVGPSIPAYMGDLAIPQIQHSYETNKMPPLLERF